MVSKSSEYLSMHQKYKLNKLSRNKGGKRKLKNKKSKK